MEDTVIKIMSREEILREALREERSFHEKIVESSTTSLQDKLEAKLCIEDINWQLNAISHNTSDQEE